MKKLIYFLLILPLLFAFGKNKKPKHSKFLTKYYVEVPAGKVVLSTKDYDIILKNKKAGQETELGIDSCETFYVSKGEVSNIHYKEFLSYLRQTGRMKEYTDNIPDTTVWRSKLSYNEPFMNYYYKHSAYNGYPVVGVTLKQANAYAEWLTEIYAMKDQEAKITFSVPTKKQWIRAARGETVNFYPWGGPNLRNSKGNYLANFKNLDAGNIHFNREKKAYELKISKTVADEMIITVPSQSYYPNSFGLYNMCGNVAELVSDENIAMGGSWNDTGYDIRVESEQSAIEPSSTVGFRVIATIEEK
ncbi:MAG: hypothetical protein COA58_10050 [Bacteroidetes bacterium]|nr:MAG: hypothetical protein COA58_10050 [Bacteroidota bacterium]